MGNTWITDMTDLPDIRNPDVDIPEPARRLAAHFGSIVKAATAHPSMDLVKTDIRCRRRPGRKPCPGNMRLIYDDDIGEIEWACTSCDDRGIIRGWEGTSRDKRVIQLFR
jgi:hypothetical protein